MGRYVISLQNQAQQAQKCRSLSSRRHEKVQCTGMSDRTRRSDMCKSQRAR
jgi:hypothetical protein